MENEWGHLNIDSQWIAKECVAMARDTIDLTIYANLNCELDGRTISIRCSRNVFTIDVSDVVSGFKLVRFGSRGHTRHRIRQIKQFLNMIQSSLHLTVAGKAVGSIGYQEGSNWWSIVGLPKLNLKISQLLWLSIHNSFSRKSK